MRDFVCSSPPLITAEEAALRAHKILEYPADDPENGWELQEFPKDEWSIGTAGKGQPGKFEVPRKLPDQGTAPDAKKTA
jgi:hypothetical protein